VHDSDYVSVYDYVQVQVHVHVGAPHDGSRARGPRPEARGPCRCPIL